VEKENADIAQISFYLAKDDATFDSILDPEAGLAARQRLGIHDFEVDGAECRFIYFETLTTKTNPPWLEFMNERLEGEAKTAFRSPSRSANGLLLVRVEGRVLAAAFGRSASSHLDRRALELDFGIKTAMNMCGNEEIRQTKSQSTAITTTHIDRQVSKPSDSFVFGLSEAEDLSYISAHLKGNKRVTLQGRDSLTYKVIGKEKLSWPRLIEECRTFIAMYDSKEYVDLFPNYRNLQPATEEQQNRLNDALIEALKAGNFAKLTLTIPEFLADDEFSFAYSNRPQRDNDIYAYLDVAQLQQELKLDDITVDRLQARWIYAYSPEEDRILDHRRWRIFNCLGHEQELDGKYFILSDGRWLQFDDEFYRGIVDFTATRLRIEPCEDLYKGIDISDDVAKKNLEGKFNEEAVRRRPSCVLFDKAKLKIGAGRKDKEFCDVLDLQDDGMIRIVNVKQFKDASSINYLFAQSKFYCEAFLHDDMFLREIRGHIAASGCASKDHYLDYIKETVEQVRGDAYRVCLWLLYSAADGEPTKEDIPLIAQYELKLMHDHLKRVCKFNDIIMRFVPVVTKQYTTRKAPAPRRAA
jgi:uncharacterized protein (TIGR04141 family)